MCWAFIPSLKAREFCWHSVKCSESLLPQTRGCHSTILVTGKLYTPAIANWKSLTASPLISPQRRPPLKRSCPAWPEKSEAPINVKLWLPALRELASMPETSIVSKPVLKSRILSWFAPWPISSTVLKIKRSRPSPPVSWSDPNPPISLSSPPPPIMTSLPVVPVILSFPQ